MQVQETLVEEEQNECIDIGQWVFESRASWTVSNGSTQTSSVAINAHVSLFFFLSWPWHSHLFPPIIPATSSVMAVIHLPHVSHVWEARWCDEAEMPEQRLKSFSSGRITLQCSNTINSYSQMPADDYLHYCYRSSNSQSTALLTQFSIGFNFPIYFPSWQSFLTIALSMDLLEQFTVCALKSQIPSKEANGHRKEVESKKNKETALQYIEPHSIMGTSRLVS